MNLADTRTRYLAVAPMALAIAIVPLLGNAYYTNLMVTIGIHTIVAVGLCLLMGFAGQVSLGHAAFYGMGAFISAILSAKYGVSPWASMVVAALVTGLVAYLVGIPIFKLKGHYLAMGTLGLGIIIHILFVELRDFTGGPSGLSGIPPLAIGDLVLDNDFKYYYLVWAVCLAILIISDNIVNSRVGRALRSIHGSESAAHSVGVDVGQLKIRVFVLSAVYAALAGSLYAHYITFISPQPFGFMFSIRLVVMVVIGGLASVWGAVFGTAAVTLLSDVLHPLGDFDVIIFGLILMLVMMLLPQGLTRAFLDLIEVWQLRLRAGRRPEIVEVES